MTNTVQWPEGKTFAFTVLDDTDYATLHNVREVYSMLVNLGFCTTKSVWPSRGSGEPICGGDTCEDAEYVDWLLGLQQRGFEIGYHMNTFHTSLREETQAGVRRFAELFGHSPYTMANHAGCEENIYWGQNRLSGMNRLLYNLLTRFRNARKYRGHIEGDRLFWGDLCRNNVKYVRGFVFRGINTLNACPFMPYHDPKRPYVNYWFASSEGPDVDSFNRCIAEAQQDRLEDENGVCIMYTHFACGFQNGTSLNRRFQSLMERLSRKNGWFVPVNRLLDHLLEHRGHRDISADERCRLERRWLLDKLHATGS